MSEENQWKETSLESYNRVANTQKTKLRHVVELAGASPPDVQLAFLYGLLSDSKESETFLKDPQGYAAQHGVVVDPNIMRGMVDTLVFGEPMSEKMVQDLGPDVTSALLELRGNGQVAAFPIAVAAAVAVASAAVALVAQAGQTLDLTTKGLGRPSRTPVGLGGTAALIYAVTSATNTVVSAVASVANTSSGVFRQ